MNPKELKDNINLKHWNDIFIDQSQSGLRINKYCEVNNISKNSFYYWKRKLKNAACNAIEAHDNAIAQSSLRSEPVFAKVNINSNPSYSSGINIKLSNSEINISPVYSYLKHLLTEIPKHMDDSNMEFLEELVPWSKTLPEDCHKQRI